MWRPLAAAACLACAVGALGVSVVAQASPTRRILEAAFKQAYDAADWPKATEAAERLTLAFPDDPLGHYHLAAVLARAGDVERAMTSLARSADLGLTRLALVERDMDIDPLRALPGFDAIVDQVKANSDQALEAFKAQAASATVLTFLPRGYSPARPTPLVVVLHDAGGRAGDVASVYRRVAQDLGAILVAPEGTVRSGRGFNWGSVEEGEYLVRRAIDQTRAKHNVDEKRIVVSGFAEGASLALIVTARQPDLFAGVVAVAAVYEERIAPLPGPLPANFPRVYLLTGSQDSGIDGNRRVANRLEGDGVAVRLRIVDGVGRAFPPNADGELREALGFVFGS